MTIFSQRIVSDDVIHIAPERAWAILRNPDDLADLTPLVAEVTADDDRWMWRLVGINAMGITAAPTFTTVMQIDDRSMTFGPEPGTTDRATATGVLEVSSAEPGWTRLAIDLVATVDIPLPSALGRAVRRVMFRTMEAGGRRFADAFLEHVGNPDHRGLDVRAGGPTVPTSRAV